MQLLTVAPVRPHSSVVNEPRDSFWRDVSVQHISHRRAASKPLFISRPCERDLMGALLTKVVFLRNEKHRSKRRSSSVDSRQ